MIGHTADAYEAVRRGHIRHATAHLHYPEGDQGELPFSGGSVAFSLSTGSGSRRGSLTIPGYEYFDKCDPKHYCWVHISIAVDGESFDLGQFPIIRDEVTRPGGEVALTLGDWAYRRAQSEAQSAVTIGSTTETVAATCQTIMGHVLPSFTITQDDSLGAFGSPQDVTLGGDIYSVLTELCNQVGCVLIVTSRSTGEIRRYDPTVPVHEDITGTVINERMGILVDEAVNAVIITADATDPEAPSMRAERFITTGPYAYEPTAGTGFGRFPYVDHIRQKVASQAIVDAEADRVYDRRAGIVRTQALTVVPQPWIQLGDVLAWRPSFYGGPLFGMVNEFTLPLTAEGTSTLTMRDTTIR